jgi:hypothetical protein
MIQSPSGRIEVRYVFAEFVTDRFRWVAWEGETILYDKLSGDTHRLAFPSGLILDLISNECPKSIEDLALELPTKRAVSSMSEDHLLTSLNALCDIGLLKSTSFENFQSLPC